MRIGFLLGSFDPLHNGHLLMATEVLNHGMCDKIVFVPTKQNPWKTEQPLLLWERSMMIRCSLESLSCFYYNAYKKMEVSMIEEHLPQPCYSCNTLKALSEVYNKDGDNELFIICGGDVLNSIHKWKDFDDKIKPFYKVIAFARQGYDSHNDNIDYELISDVQLPPFSSSEIREKIKRKEIIMSYVPNAIIEICKESYFK